MRATWNKESVYLQLKQTIVLMNLENEPDVARYFVLWWSSGNCALVFVQVVFIIYYICFQHWFVLLPNALSCRASDSYAVMSLSLVELLKRFSLIQTEGRVNYSWYDEERFNPKANRWAVPSLTFLLSAFLASTAIKTTTTTITTTTTKRKTAYSIWL